MIYNITESYSEVSKVDEDHQKRNGYKLSDFTMKQSDMPGNHEGRPFKLVWFDKDGNRMGWVQGDRDYAIDGYKWIGSLRVVKKYRGYGLADEIIELLKNKYQIGALAVDKKNEIAIRLYRKHGFEEHKKKRKHGEVEGHILMYYEPNFNKKYVTQDYKDRFEK